MRALININTSPEGWTQEYFPEQSHYTLPIAGKHLGGYQLDLLSKLGASSVRVIDYNFDLHLAHELQDNNHWPLEIDYRGGGYCDNIQKLISQNQSFCEQEPMLVIYGLIFVQATSEEIEAVDFETLEECKDNTKEGIFYYKDGVLKTIPLKFARVGSILEYFHLNFHVLHHASNYILPAYKVEDGVYTGMNDVIMPLGEIRPPVLLGDNVLLYKGCQLEGDVVIGRDVIVDENCYLRSCVIFEKTYVCEGMELVNKIVNSSRIIDPLTGAYISMTDECFVSEMRNYWKVNVRVIFDYLFALLLVAGMTIPYLIVQFFRLFGKGARTYYKLTLDKYPRLLRVLCFRGKLVGGGNDPGRPAAFSYSDSFSLRRDSIQRELDDSYFYLHDTFYMCFKTIVKAFINRLFITDRQWHEEEQSE